MVFNNSNLLSSLILNRSKMIGTVLEQILSKFQKPESIKIRNKARTSEILENLVNQGPQSLQVITDFDATLTKYHVNGNKCDSCYGIIANTPLISAEYRKKALDLYNKYYPIEVDSNMTIEQKIPHMVEWYKNSHEFMIAANPKVNRTQIQEMVCKSTSFLRDNAKTMLETLHRLDVPVLVLSAGIGDLVEEVLLQCSANLPNVKIISNFMLFDEQENVVGFKDPLIHMYNKNEAALHAINSSYFEKLNNRNNVILMGDSLGDTNMEKGVAEPDVVLKIGFLNTHFDTHLELFMEVYDVVLVDDQSMDFTNLLIDHVIKT